MIIFIICATIGFVVLGFLAADLWRAHLVLRELEAAHAFDVHADQALDVAADDWQCWEQECAS